MTIKPMIRPCKRGHKRGRYASTGQCIDCVQLYSKKKRNIPGTVKVRVVVPVEDTAAIEAMALGMCVDRGLV